MLIKLSDIISRYNLNIRGVLHVGGHHGQEYSDYKAAGINNIVFFEPGKAAFDQLTKRLSDKNAMLLNFALGAECGEAMMYCETANQGQSNSLLKPAKHLKQYPSIRFNEQESVQVRTMDSFNLPADQYNMINMDVQGYELHVLRGSVETLKNIDIIYTEVNRDEVYEGCARVEQLDDFLSPDFKRVETNWGGDTWGDALYIRQQKAIDYSANQIHWVPKEFQPHHPFQYPADNDQIFEEWYFRNSSPGGRTYLPIFWTSYYVAHKYGKDKKAIDRLQAFLDSLDRSIKYYTIVQYDDGILNNISHLDIQVFSMSGKPMDYPLPLICKPHKYPSTRTHKPLLASFIGRNTHPIRKEVLSLKARAFLVTEHVHRMDHYCKTISESIFTLAPRGYGPSSFRIMEAMQYGSIPVYISDEFIIPHRLPFGKFGLLVEPKDIKAIPDILHSLQRDEVAEMQQNIHHYWPLFTYEGSRDLILKNL